MQNIQVFVRCRPLNAREKRSTVYVVPEGREVRVSDNKKFQFDKVFDQSANQDQVYDAVVGPLIDQVLLGFNCTVFAYGQTGTGKTYTMEGYRTEGENNWEDDPNSGIIPRSISQLFDTLRTHDSEFTVRVSFLELYNEDTYDLLSAVDDTTKLKVFEDSHRKGSVIVGGLEEVIVQSKAEIYDIMKRGSAKRQTAATLLNACSSRSHTIFSVTVHIREGSDEGEELLKIGKLNLVDLAGSENIGRSGAQDRRAREAGSINQSLLTLGRVITALVEKRSHIPYRESKLTRLLQDSLGGKTKTSIIATVSPAVADLEDTLSTLEYASRAKKITNKPEMNKRLTKKELLREYTNEIERLRRDLQATREKNGVYVDPENYEAMRKGLSEKEDRIGAIQGELEKSRKLFEDFTTQYEQTKVELDKAKENCERQEKWINNQKCVEKKLADHAAKLIQVAETATSDNHLLHGKKERIENILRENRQSIDRFQPKIKNDVTRLDSLIEHYTKEITSMRESFSDQLRQQVETSVGVTEQEAVARLKSRVAELRKKSDIFSEQAKILSEQAKIFSNLAKENAFNSKNLLDIAQELENEIGELCKDNQNRIQDAMSQVQSCDATNAEKLKQVVSTMTSSIKREMHTLRQEFEWFLTREIKEDSRTGLTPQRKTYDIPKRLDLRSMDESMSGILEGGEDNKQD